MTTLDTWLSALAYTDFGDDLFRVGESAGVRPYAAEIDEMLAPNGRIGASAVFCVGDQPTICFLDGAGLEGDVEKRVEADPAKDLESKSGLGGARRRP